MEDYPSEEKIGLHFYLDANSAIYLIRWSSLYVIRTRTGLAVWLASAQALERTQLRSAYIAAKLFWHPQWSRGSHPGNNSIIFN